jgi:hypothetical protein
MAGGNSKCEWRCLITRRAYAAAARTANQENMKRRMLVVACTYVLPASAKA